MNAERWWLILRAWCALARYDVAKTLFGFRSLASQLGPQCAAGTVDPERIARLCDAVDLAACFYFKPVFCVQRSSALVRILRKQSINSELVIGYRPVPFLAHSWVESGGRVVGDSSRYRDLLKVLQRL